MKRFKKTVISLAATATLSACGTTEVTPNVVEIVKKTEQVTKESSANIAKVEDLSKPAPVTSTLPPASNDGGNVEEKVKENVFPDITASVPAPVQTPVGKVTVYKTGFESAFKDYHSSNYFFEPKPVETTPASVVADTNAAPIVNEVINTADSTNSSTKEPIVGTEASESTNADLENTSNASSESTNPVNVEDNSSSTENQSPNIETSTNPAEEPVVGTEATESTLVDPIPTASEDNPCSDSTGCIIE